MWPDFALNVFYRLYDSAEGWLAKGYLAIWSRQEVPEYRAANLDTYPGRYHFFASDGGGTQFGFFQHDGAVQFVSAPYIGTEDDIRVLGDWSQFSNAIAQSEYI